MQPRCTQRLPPQGSLYRVIRKYRFLVIVTLIQANALTLPQVYGWDYFYCDPPSFLCQVHYIIIRAVVVVGGFSLTLTGVSC